MFKRIFNSLLLKKVGRRWGARDAGRKQSNYVKSRWWQFSAISEQIDNDVYSVNGLNGFIGAAIDKHKILPCVKGVSVGCGNASKEMDLLVKGLVEHFDLYEMSEARIEEAKSNAAKLGLSDRITFNLIDAFKANVADDSYDLVYWDNSLHHMFDVEEAVEWSQRVLKGTGGLLINDFIGASRFQWPQTELAIAKDIRECFVGTEYLHDTNSINTELPTKVNKPTKLGMWIDDPSEAADSSRIVESVIKYFPNAQIHYTGGVVYHLALNGMLSNFDDEKDKHILKLLMMIDRMASDNGENHYAVMYSRNK